MTSELSGLTNFTSRFFTKIDYLMRETLLGLRRGGWLNWAAVSTLMVLLFLVGISLQLSWGLEQTLQSLGSQVEISAFLRSDVEGSSLADPILGLDGVAQLRVIDKNEAWKDLLDAMGTADPQTTAAELGSNPLVDSLRIQAQSAEYLPAIATAVKRFSGVDEVYYGSEVVERLGQLHDGLQVGTIAISGGLTLTTVAVITTTIRLIVMARRREIEVMALVGATSTWIYLPFILQGIFFGVVGAIAAWGLVLGSQQLLGDVLSHLLAMPFLKIADPSSYSTFGTLPLTLLAIGTVLGATGSLIAVRKTAVR
ncbi:ABC transporter permease [Synechococcus sp. PCC 7336]|uniref:cell division protein FtsX n=1 Tax=Synechococcus sp. PCC 7336 TaxID=195250 RepID=UPI00034AD51F|nr:ABC transporter permease [Synechococcus sp. PCC 7336]